MEIYNEINACPSRKVPERINLVYGPENVKCFLKEIIQVCKKHKMSISHEDTQGAFLIKKFDKDLANWLESAHFEEMDYGLIGKDVD